MNGLVSHAGCPSVIFAGVGRDLSAFYFDAAVSDGALCSEERERQRVHVIVGVGDSILNDWHLIAAPSLVGHPRKGDARYANNRSDYGGPVLNLHTSSPNVEKGGVGASDSTSGGSFGEGRA